MGKASPGAALPEHDPVFAHHRRASADAAGGLAAQHRCVRGGAAARPARRSLASRAPGWPRWPPGGCVRIRGAQSPGVARACRSSAFPAGSSSGPTLSAVAMGAVRPGRWCREGARSTVWLWVLRWVRSRVGRLQSGSRAWQRAAGLVALLRRIEGRGVSRGALSEIARFGENVGSPPSRARFASLTR